MPWVDDDNRDVAELDAYGHLSWAVGNEDWIACFDARVQGDAIEYHVVVNCESGGFVDTLERSTVPLTRAGIKGLMSLPDYWADICAEHYLGSVDPKDTARTRKSWAKHLRWLLAVGPCREDHYCGCCSECLTEESDDPAQNGWIGKDGRP
jgi:hypothetical protein